MGDVALTKMAGTTARRTEQRTRFDFMRRVVD
jgi:hypothetical protein